MALSTAVVPTSFEQNRKLFLGGLLYTTTDATLKEYCSKYGEITECIIIRDREGQSRGFGFVSFKDSSMVQSFMEHRPHAIDGKKIEVKRALSRDQASKPDGQLTVKKVFIGGITAALTEDDLNAYFEKFGITTDCNIMKDKQDKLRGFAFLTFEDYDSVDRCILEKPHLIKGIELDVRKAIPREQRPSINPPISTNQVNPEFYYPSSMMFNQPLISPPPYTYFYPTNYLTKPIAFVGQINPYFPQEWPKKIPRSHLINDEQNRKLFIGGLSFKTTDETLRNYVTKYGEITDCLVMKGDHGQSKCFGFVTFLNPTVVDEFMQQRPHIIDDRQVDPKRAMPREEANNDDVHLTVKKIFIGGIRDGIDEDSLRNYFSTYGNINDCLVMHDKDGKTRGFAFIEFDDYDSVDKIILARPHTIGRYHIDVKKAVPKDQRVYQAQQKRYALQMQATSAYYSNPFVYHLFTNPLASFPTPNGAFIDNHPSNSLRYLPARNTNNSQ